MFPTILVSNNQKSIESYISELKENQQFSDIQQQVVDPEKTSISIGQVRELRKELSITVSKPRLIILNSFDTATLEAQNALLKILEEYNKNNQFIMIVERIHNIIPTIISRSRVIQLEQEQTLIDENTANTINSFLKDPSVRYLAHPVFTVTSKEEASILLRIFLQLMREQLPTNRYKSAEQLKLAFHLLYKLENNNLSPQLTIDNLLMSIIKSKKA